MALSTKLPVLAAACCVMLVGCSTGGGLSADGAYFQGLPPSVVNEALALPYFQQTGEGLTGGALQSSAQAGVRNMIFCREELHVYQVWTATGQPPAITPGPVPTHPLEPGNAAIVQDYESLRTAVRSGDPSQLRLELTANGSCGQWVPATPGTRGPTIAQVVNRGQQG